MERLASTLPSIIEIPDASVDDGRGGSGRNWIVTVFDNDFNTEAEVIHILIVATGCSEEEASIETWEVHNLGKSVVHHGEQQECESAAAVIAQIGIDVRVSEE